MGRRSTTYVLFLAAITMLFASACGKESADDGDARIDQYVALGDSYTSAPFVPTTAPSDPCLRSTGNYPHLVAAALGDVELVDVSCGDATTADMAGSQKARGVPQPPQFDALSAETDLVTVGIGGNDLRFLESVIYACARLAPLDRSGSPCRDAASTDGVDAERHLDLAVDSMQKRVVSVIEGIRSRAPSAIVILVPYPQLLPRTGTCPDVMPLARLDYRFTYQAIEALSGALVEAAESAGVDFVDVYGASQGHDVCSSSPWVNGVTAAPGRGEKFHPVPEEQQAVADLILAKLSASQISG